jgi:hypothetical protein
MQIRPRARTTLSRRSQHDCCARARKVSAPQRRLRRPAACQCAPLAATSHASLARASRVQHAARVSSRPRLADLRVTRCARAAVPAACSAKKCKGLLRAQRAQSGLWSTSVHAARYVEFQDTIVLSYSFLLSCAVLAAVFFDAVVECTPCRSRTLARINLFVVVHIQLGRQTQPILHTFLCSARH